MFILNHKWYLSYFLTGFVLIWTKNLASSAPALPSEEECLALLNQSDSCIREAFLFGDPNAKFPQSDAEIDFHCSRAEGYMKCVKNYGRCLKPFPRQILYIMISNLKKLMKETCDSREGRDEFLIHSKCMTPDKVPEAQKLMDKITMHFDFIANNVSNVEKIPFLCCSSFIGRAQLEKEVMKMCQNTTGEATKNYILKMLDKASGDANEIACGKYSTIEACTKEIPEGFKTLQEIAESQDFLPQKTSFFVPLIKITRDLDDFNDN